MADARDVTINIIGRDKTAAAARAAASNLDRVKKAQSGLSDSFTKGAAVVAGVTVALAAANKVLQDGLRLGLMRANAQVALGTTGFREMSAQADATANSLGLTSTEFLGAAGQAANLARNLGFGEDEAAKFGGQLPELANRLSVLSSGQIDAAQASDTLRSALAGEYDPLQAVGIAISDAAVQQEKLNVLKRTGGKVTDTQAQALAVLAIVQRQTSQATAVMNTEEGRRAMAVQKSNAELRENIDLLKEQAAGPLSSAVGGLSKYISFIDKVTGKNAEARREGESMLDYFNRVADEVVHGEEAAEGLTSATEGLTRVTVTGKLTQQQYAAALDAARTAAERNSNTALTLREATRQTKEAVDQAKQALKDNGRTLSDNTSKGRANAAALDAIAGAANREARAILDAGGSQDTANAALRRGKKAFEDLAQKAGLSAGKARELSSALFAIPETVTTRVITKYETRGQQPKYRYGNSPVLAQSVDAMWAGLDAAQRSRTEPPRDVVVNTGPTNVQTTVTIGGETVAAVARSVVVDDNQRSAHRLRYGRR